MKLSEFDQRSFSMWERSVYSHSVSYKDFARLRRDGAEAAGVVWDSEEEPLPEKLRIANPSNVVESKASPSPIILPAGRFWETVAARDAGYTEAVRRYNAWPELLRLPDDMERGDWTAGKPIARLHAILRGS